MPASVPDKAKTLLRDARSVVVMTGAGISAESGIPTFRDAQEGLWAKFDPTELATPEAFERQPAYVTQWYDQRRMDVLQCEPNAGHHALARLEQQLNQRGGAFALITQNVDQLHQRAGSQNVIELHGSLFLWHNADGGEAREVGPEPFEDYPPTSESGALLRPGVTWFGEMLPSHAVDAATEAVSHCDLMLSVGTSAEVYPAAGFIESARIHGAALIEINPETTPLSAKANATLHAPAGQALPALVDAALGEPATHHGLA
jgi:NAD-dependent deacetylase